MTSQRKERHPPIIILRSSPIIDHRKIDKNWETQRRTITNTLKQERQRQSSDTLADTKRAQSFKHFKVTLQYLFTKKE
jgi:hypothetical protein